MTYKEATEYLFDSVPMFQNVGGAAYKEGLDNTRALDEHFGHPHRQYNNGQFLPHSSVILSAKWTCPPQ